MNQPEGPWVGVKWRAPVSLVWATGDWRGHQLERGRWRQDVPGWLRGSPWISKIKLCACLSCCWRRCRWKEHLNIACGNSCGLGALVRLVPEKQPWALGGLPRASSQHSPSCLLASTHWGLFSRSVVSDSATPWIAACQASLSITNSWSSPKLTPVRSDLLKSCLEETNTWKRSAPRLNSCVTFGTSAPASPHVQWGSWAPLLAYGGGKMGPCVWRVLGLRAQWWMIPAVPAAATATITLTYRWMQPKPGTEKEAQCWEARGEQGWKQGQQPEGGGPPSCLLGALEKGSYERDLGWVTSLLQASTSSHVTWVDQYQPHRAVY